MNSVVHRVRKQTNDRRRLLNFKGRLRNLLNFLHHLPWSPSSPLPDTTRTFAWPAVRSKGVTVSPLIYPQRTALLRSTRLTIYAPVVSSLDASHCLTRRNGQNQSQMICARLGGPLGSAGRSGLDWLQRSNLPCSAPPSDLSLSSHHAYRCETIGRPTWDLQL